MTVSGEVSWPPMGNFKWPLTLSQLGELDGLSEQWIRDVLGCVNVDQSRLDFVEGDLVRECQTSPLWSGEVDMPAARNREWDAGSHPGEFMNPLM